MLQNYNKWIDLSNFSGEIYPILHRFRLKYLLFGRNLLIFYEVSPESGSCGALSPSLLSLLRFFSLIFWTTLANIAQSTKNATTPMAQTVTKVQVALFVIPDFFAFKFRHKITNSARHINIRCKKVFVKGQNVACFEIFTIFATST